jgi:uncharacterized protein
MVAALQGLTFLSLGMAEEIRVNFGRPMPLFPLPGAVLLPHAVQPLHIFEKRYRQMVNACLDGPGQIAMASFSGRDWPEEYEGTPALRPMVCIGQIVQHVPQSDGTHDILLQGVCRARIMEILEPQDDRLYRQAKLAPVDEQRENPPNLSLQRRQLRDLLNGPRLKRLRGVDRLMEWFADREVPTPALLELIGSALMHDGEVRYQLLAEPNPAKRARIITRELSNLDELVRTADRQPWRDWPKGMSWN